MKKNTLIATALISVIVVGGIILYLKRFPKITIIKKDNLKKTATIQIGNKTVNYVFNTQTALEVPNVSLLYSATIVPNVTFSKIQIKRKGRVVSEQTLTWD